MSNEELIKQFYVAIKNHDKETYLKLCDKNIEWQTFNLEIITHTINIFDISAYNSSEVCHINHSV